MKLFKIKLLFFLNILLSLTCNAQNIDSICTIHTKEICYYVNDKETIYLTYEIFNNSENTIWVWFNKENKKDLSTQNYIRQHFLKRKGDFSLSQLSLENNIDINSIDLFSSFFRIILSGGKFVIHVIMDDKTEAMNISNYLNNHIIGVNENEINKFIPDSKSLAKIMYKNDSVIILSKYLIEK